MSTREIIVIKHSLCAALHERMRYEWRREMINNKFSVSFFSSLDTFVHSSFMEFV
jgi:hypothetical protein